MRRPRAPATIRSALAALTAIVAVPLVALGGYGILRAYWDRRDAEIEASAELARAVALGVEAFVADVLRVEQSIAVSNTGHSSQQLSRDLDAIATENPELRDVSWVDRDGTVLASSAPALVGTSLVARDYFHEIAWGAEWRVSALFRSMMDDAPVFVVARGVRDARGALRAVVAATVDATHLERILGRRSREGWTAIIDSAGTLVAMAPMRPLDWETRRRTAAHPWVERALSGEEVRGAFDAATNTERRIGAVVPIAPIGWVAHASRPLAETLGPARREAALNALAALGLLLASLGVAFVVARSIGGPLRALEHHAAELAGGSSAPARIRGPLEVRRVARALDGMASSLAARRTELEAARRGAEEATARAEVRGAELDAIVAALPVGLLVLDETGAAVRVNGRAEEILGLGEDELRVTTPEERARRYHATTSDARPLLAENHPAMRALRGETVRGQVLRTEPRPGVTTWIALSAAPVRGPEARGRGAVVTIVDVTQLRGLEAERDTLLHTVSHDLRTPLHVIVSHAELLRRRGDEEVRRRAEAIVASAGRMQRLVEDLVDAARLETGQVKLHLEPVDLGHFLAAWRDRMAGALHVERVRISAPESLPVVVADPARLDQILANLVSNALKYSVEGAPVDVELAAAADALRLCVRDRGHGIAADDLPRVFERYWRGKGTGRAEGLGLGLFITRKLVEAHGWRIEVASEIGRGTIFTIVIPLADARVAPGEGAAA